MFSERLQALIDKLGWNQSKLAREIDSSSVQIGRWLQNKVAPTANSIRRIADATGCSLDWLLTGEGGMFIEGLYPLMSQEELEKDAQEHLDMILGQDDERRKEERKREIAKLLAKAEVVLEFKFKHNTQFYSDSLATTINALYRAVRLEEKFVPKRGLVAVMDPGHLI